MARMFETSHEECPVCHQHTGYSNGRLNLCTNPDCSFSEKVEVPQMMTKWDIIDLLKNDDDVKKAVLKIMDDKYQAVMAEADRERVADEERLLAEEKDRPAGGLEVGD